MSDTDDRDFYEGQIGDALHGLAVGLRLLRDFALDHESDSMEIVKAQEWLEDVQRTLENALPTPYQRAMRQ